MPTRHGGSFLKKVDDTAPFELLADNDLAFSGLIPWT